MMVLWSAARLAENNSFTVKSGVGRCAGLAAFLLAMTVPMFSPQAAAQGQVEYLWGGKNGEEEPRRTVGFDNRFAAGEIIVSFADRRLYHVTERGVDTFN